MAWWSSWQSSASRSKASWAWKRQSGASWNKWEWPAEKKDEGWDCKVCSTNNWWSRHSCRGCECDSGSAAKNVEAFSNAGSGDGEAGDPKVVAAAKVMKLEDAIARLGNDPLMATAKLELERELQKQQKLAKDTRSTARKLDQKQGWIERETKRLEAETKQLAEQQKSLEERQKQLQVEIGEMAKLKLELTSEGAAGEEDVDMVLSPEQVAELRKMEERELGIRRNIGRRRKPEEQADASLEVMGQWAEEADAISAQIGKRRQELVASEEAKRRKA
jgi:hypothetical protein